MKLHRLITGPIFLLLFLIVTPLRWLLMHAFGYVCKLSNWVTENFRESLGMKGLRWLLMHVFVYLCKLSDWVTAGFRESLGMEE